MNDTKQRPPEGALWSQGLAHIGDGSSPKSCYIASSYYSLPTRITKDYDAMKDDTIAIHHGYMTDPTTKSVAVPIYQTVAYEFRQCPA